MTSTLIVTKKGQITLKRDLLHHLGITPGERISIDQLPDGELRIRAAHPPDSIEGFIGLLKGKSDAVLSVEEMSEIASKGWAGEK